MNDRQRRAAWWMAAVFVATLVVAWSTGRFDRALYPVGLNTGECAQTLTGATLCGDDLREYRAVNDSPLLP